MSKPTTHERKADAENVLTCVMLRYQDAAFRGMKLNHEPFREILKTYENLQQ